MSRYQQTALTNLDSYKLSHPDQYPQGTSKVYVNLTPRSVKHLGIPAEFKTDEIVWFGVQAFLHELVHVWDETFFKVSFEEATDDFMDLVGPFCGPRGYDRSRLRWLHDLGYLPLHIKALPEGMLVPAGVPVMTIINTLPEARWLPGAIETWLSAFLWKASTSATISYAYRRIIDQYSRLTGCTGHFSAFQGHDFSPRGMSGLDDAARSGAGHLLSFLGTDNIPAVKLVRDVYHGRGTLVGTSVPATEHATMTTGILQHAKVTGCSLAEAESAVFRRLITEIYPAGIVSVVSDSFDFWQVITNIAPSLRDEIMNRQLDSNGMAKVVFRPDSGDPVEIICGLEYHTVKDINDDVEMCKVMCDTGHVGEGVVHNLADGRYYRYEEIGDDLYPELRFEEVPEHVVKGAVQCLWDSFGGYYNHLGYRVVKPYVGLIYGDSITLSRCQEILQRLMARGFAADNVVFGIGSYTFQYTTRDSCGFAVKATYAEIDGQGLEVYKDPATDSGTKRSAHGLLQVVQQDQRLVLNQNVTWQQEQTGMLRTVFQDGVITVDDDFETIRQRLGVVMPYVIE